MYIYIVYITASMVLFPLLLLAVSSRTQAVVVYCGESRQHHHYYCSYAAASFLSIVTDKYIVCLVWQINK